MPQTFRNPIVPGFAPDPSVVQVDGIFYLATSSFHLFPGIPIYASIDLQEWTQIGNAVNRSNELDLGRATTSAMPLDDGNVMVASGGLFAPTIRYQNGTFYIVCTNCYHGESNWMTDNFILSTTDIWSDKWSSPTYFSFYGIDPSLFFDDDGRAYIQGSWMMDRMKQPSCTIKQFEIDIATGEALSPIREIWPGFAKRDTEGPHIYKKDGWYYLLVAEGGTFEHHMLSISRASDIWGPYESCPNNPIMTADGTGEYIQNIGHGELFQDTHGHWWAAVLGVRDEPGNQAMGRETFLTPVEWPVHGWPVISQPSLSFTTSRSPQKASASRKFYEKCRAVSPQVGDLYLYQPLFNPYITPSTIVLSPTCTSLSSSTCTLALLARRQRSHTSVAHATFRISHNGPSVAGLTVYKDPVRHLSISYFFLSRSISCTFVDTSRDIDRHILYPPLIPQDVEKLEVRVEASSTKYLFSFRASGIGREEGSEWKEVGQAEAALLSARDFTGAVIGVFALLEEQSHEVHEKAEIERQAVIFDNFQVEDK